MRKSILLLFAMLLAVAAYSQSRDGRSPARRREFNPEMVALAQTNNLHKVLQLDSMQYNMVMLMNYSDAMAMQDSMKARAARQGEKRVQPTEEERRARAEVMKQRRALRDEQMKKILTPEQYEKYIKYMEESAKNGRPSGKRPRREGPRGGAAPFSEPESDN